jgi:enterochelin esterase family protein
MKRVFLLSILIAAVRAQTSPPPPPPPPPPLRSPEVHADRTVTFRFRDPNAHEVILGLEGAPGVPMQKDEHGVWTLTTDPLPPDLYGYTFRADGVGLMDPGNPLLKPNLLNTQNMVDVPDPSLPWEISDVPHGTVEHRFYKSGVVGDQRDFYVYTPPGYDASARTRYPVLYLLHGYSDDASGWTAVGRANIILDNLIAQGKAKPMVIVMTLGYGAPEIVTGGWGGTRGPDLLARNYNRYRDALFTEVIPMVEKGYRVETNRNARAIAGLSMGGAESLFVGLNALDRFAWVASFSAGGQQSNLDETFPNLDARANAQLHLLWIACGTDDRLIEANRKFRAWLDTKGVHHTDIETPGAHTWMVWRRNLAAFAPLLFQ